MSELSHCGSNEDYQAKECTSIADRLLQFISALRSCALISKQQGSGASVAARQFKWSSVRRGQNGPSERLIVQWVGLTGQCPMEFPPIYRTPHLQSPIDVIERLDAKSSQLIQILR